MKRLLTLTLILGIGASYGQEMDKKELKKVFDNSSLKSLTSLSELASLASLSELSSLQELSSLASLSSLADQANTVILPPFEMTLDRDVVLHLEELADLSERSIENALDVMEVIDMEALNELMDKAIKEAKLKEDN